jgi:S1-C subfamily serine protease
LSINPTPSNQWQVFIQQIYSNAPASNAGFHDGDILVRITSNEVHRSTDVLNTMFYHRVGDQVEFTVLRNGQAQKFLLVVGNRPAEVATSAPPIPQAGSTKQPGQWPTMVPASQER